MQTKGFSNREFSFVVSLHLTAGNISDESLVSGVTVL